MAGRWTGHHHDIGDVLALCSQLEKQYGIRVKLSIVPFPEARGKATHAVLATPYKPSGRVLKEVPAEQHLWPSAGHRNVFSLWVKLLYDLMESLDEYAARKRREEEAQSTPALLPIEEYISASGVSSGLPT